MNIQNHRLVKIIFVIFFSLTVSQCDFVKVDAGEDQVVNAGDKVHLRGTIKYWTRSNKYRSKKKFKHDDNLVIEWCQDEGTKVDLIKPHKLHTKFVAPTPFAFDEILGFTLTVKRHGRVIGRDSVEVKAQRPTISGRITAVDGMELQDISINVLSKGTVVTSEISDVNGDFFFDLPGNRDFVLALSGDGYADQVVPVRNPGTHGSLFLDITMISRGSTEGFTVGEGSMVTISGVDGASVTVTDNSFVDENDDRVDGEIHLTITPVDVSRQAYLAAFPGTFSGVLEGAREASPFYSLGAAEFEFTQNGQPVQLADGEFAVIQIPIYFNNYQDGTPIKITDPPIPLWSLNEDTGIWEQEGTGTVVPSPDSPTGLAMEATVGHFSWWNCDVTMNAAQAIVTVFGGSTGTVLIKARTNADIAWGPNTVETVSQVGVPTAPLWIPSNGEVCFWAEINFDNGSSGSTPEVCITAAPNSIVNVDLDGPMAGDVNIITIPAATADVLDVVAYAGFAVDRVQLLSSTYETAVSYTISSGALPAGLELNTVNSTRAEITGVPTVADEFSVDVTARDSDDFTYTVTINYDVIAGEPPPELDESIFISYTWDWGTSTATPSSVNMNAYNTGGAATDWSFSFPPSDPPPEGLSLHPDTGILTITAGEIVWWRDVTLTASNASGTSEADFIIEDSDGS